jgi:hypothetical protein
LPGDHLSPIRSRLSIGQEPNTLSATAEVVNVSLPKEEERVLGPQSFEDRLKQEDQNQRWWTATRIIWTLIGSNILTLVLLGGLAWLDQTNIERTLISPRDRIITAQVLMALFGATAVQVGTIAAITARHQFPGRSRDG